MAEREGPVFMRIGEFVVTDEEWRKVIPSLCCTVTMMF